MIVARIPVGEDDSIGDNSLGWRRYTQLGKIGSVGDDGLGRGRYTQPGKIGSAGQFDCCMLRNLNSAGKKHSVGE